jgi:hypothetical protein
MHKKKFLFFACFFVSRGFHEFIHGPALAWENRAQEIEACRSSQQRCCSAPGCAVALCSRVPIYDGALRPLLLAHRRLDVFCSRAQA